MTLTPLPALSGSVSDRSAETFLCDLPGRPGAKKNVTRSEWSLQSDIIDSPQFSSVANVSLYAHPLYKYEKKTEERRYNDGDGGNIGTLVMVLTYSQETVCGKLGYM